MTTARRIINRALRLIQVLAAGETPRGSEAADSLEALDSMLASWSASNLIVPCMVKCTMHVRGGVVQYPLPIRPTRIVGAWVNDGSNDLPMSVISQADYLGIMDKGFQGLPASLFCDDLYPVASIYLYPVPDKSYVLTLRRWDALAKVSALDDDMELPGEYTEAMAANLAVRLAPEYGTSVSSEVSAMAATALDLLRGLNAQPIATLSVGIQSTSRRYGDGVGHDSMALFRSGAL